MVDMKEAEIDRARERESAVWKIKKKKKTLINFWLHSYCFVFPQTFMSTSFRYDDSVRLTLIFFQKSLRSDFTHLRANFDCIFDRLHLILNSFNSKIAWIHSTVNLLRYTIYSKIPKLEYLTRFDCVQCDCDFSFLSQINFPINFWILSSIFACDIFDLPAIVFSLFSSDFVNKN